jgi:AraC-like DNA-binding protein
MDLKKFDQHRFYQKEFGLLPSNPIMVIDDYYDNLNSNLYDIHYDYEVGVVCSGKVIRKYRNVEIALGKGDVWITGIWEPHGFELEQVPCEMMSFIISPESIEKVCPPGFDWIKIFSSDSVPVPKVSKEHKKEVLRACDKVRQVLKGKGETSIAWMSNMLSTILLCIVDDNFNSYKEVHSESDKFVSHDEVKKVVDLVFETKGDVNVSDAAAKCMMSTSHFSRLFKKATGITFAKFTLGYRVKQSAISLADGKEPIKKIAKDWGFNDSSHYTKAFEKFFSMPPSEFRKIYQVE